MNRTMTQASWLVVALLLAGVAVAQSDFSAEIVNTQRADPGGATKIFISKD